ncbi:MAG TPA: peptidoglycan-binding domain-containing protein, partial [Acidimicrobiales bacterium]|nr:peptidoglycan-binding domain-containing protein [Acidimicrobiales bacterium]
PEWTAAVEFLRHKENDPAAAPRPGNPAAVTDPAVPPQEALAQYLAAATNLDGYAGQWGRGQEIVGYPNFGDIRFAWGPGDQKSVRQTLWWRLPDAARAAPLTTCVATLPLGAAPLGGSPLYGGFILREGDRDATPPVYGGAQQPAGTHSGYVRQLQDDLVELGFSLVGTPGGVFDRNCRWAVRELQAYAKGTHVARDRQPSPRPTRYSECLEAVAVPAEQRYAGPASGVADLATQAVIGHWKTNRWRCPVVIEAWNMSGGLPGSIFQIPAAGTTPARPAHNIWRHDDMRSSGPRVFAVDLSGRWTMPARAPDASNHPELIVLGAWDDFTQWDQTWEGAWANPNSRHTWRPEAEMLPQHMLPVPEGATTGPTLAQLVADRSSSNAATAQRARRQLSTYKVVRAVAEIEALGYFDVYNTYDTAFMSCGPCHWTAGPTIKPDPAVGPTAEWAVDEGELWAFLSYLRSVDRASFDVLCAHHGLDVADLWGVDGADLWVSSQRKYTSRPTLTDEAGNAQPIPARVKEFDLFRSWHWAFRFAMCGRTVDGYRRRMHNMARQRLVDVLGTPWDSPAPGTAASAPDVPTGAGPGAPTRRARIGDLFTSERAAAMIMRWHVLSPGGMVKGGPAGENQPIRRQGRAGNRIRDAYTRAQAARPDLNWTTAPTTWGNAHEAALVDGIWDEADEVGGEMERTIRLARDWPDWGANPRGWSLPLTDLPAAERNLLVARNSLDLDSSALPTGAGT